MKNVLYISSLLPFEEYKFYAEKNEIASYASQRFHRCFANGLNDNGVEVSFISICRGNQKQITNHLNWKFINQFSSKILNTLFLTRMIYKSVKRFLRNNKECYIIFDSINLFTTNACFKLEKKYKNRFIPIVTDVYGKRSFKTKNLLKKYFEKTHEKKLTKFSKLVLLTDSMNELYKTGLNQTSIMEGFSSEMPLKPKNEDDKHNIMYAGIIDEVFGLEKLIDAFKILGSEYQLNLYGDWKMKKTPVEIGNTIPNVNYHGVIPNESVIEAERNCDLLINPRSNDGEFTKFSFPSKTLEYLSTGTPVMCAKLDGIPDEYFKYLVELDASSSISIANCIKKFFISSLKSRQEIGASGSEFAVKFKNPKVQIQKIIKELNLWTK